MASLKDIRHVDVSRPIVSLKSPSFYGQKGTGYRYGHLLITERYSSDPLDDNDILEKFQIRYMKAFTNFIVVSDSREKLKDEKNTEISIAEETRPVENVTCSPVTQPIEVEEKFESEASAEALSNGSRLIEKRLTLNEKALQIEADPKYLGKWVAIRLSDLDIITIGEEIDKVMEAALKKAEPSNVSYFFVQGPETEEYLL